MAKLKIEGVGPHADGEHEIDLAGLNGREAHLIKQVSGVRLGEIGEALNAGDYDVVVAIAKIVLDRAGQTVPVAALLEAPIGKITVDLTSDATDAKEDEDRPPAPSQTGNGSESAAAAPSSESESNELSGASSSDGGDHHQSDQSPTGDLGSEQPLGSVPPTSES